MISEYVNLMKKIIESDIEKRIATEYVEDNKGVIFDRIDSVFRENIKDCRCTTCK